MDNKLLAENRARGWANVSEKSPAWVLERICAFRSAVLAGQEFRMTPTQVRESDARFLAATSRGFVPDTELRAIAARQAKQIGAERQLFAWDRLDAKERAAKLERFTDDEIRDMRRRNFPWETYRGY